MSNPEFSFIIPTYNSADTLKCCIEHINGQSLLSSKEIIIVDNGSEDKTQEIAKNLGLKVLIDPEATIAKLRNIGARATNGEFIVFVDSDCLIKEDFLAIAKETLKEQEVGMTGARTHFLPENASWVTKTWKLHLDQTESDNKTTWLVTRALVVRRTAFLEVGGFNESLATCEDVALGHAIYKNYKIVADKRLAPIHLKDANTLSEFFKKEIWRGKNSIETSYNLLIKDRNWSIKELLSLTLPFYFIIGICFAFFSLLLGAFCLFSLSLFFIPMPLILITTRTVLKTKNFKHFVPLLLLYLTYIAARIIALIKEALSITKR